MPKPKLDERHDILLRFLQGRGQAWDTTELSFELGYPRHQINRLGRDLAEHQRVQLSKTEKRGTLQLRAERNA